MFNFVSSSVSQFHLSVNNLPPHFFFFFPFKTQEYLTEHILCFSLHLSDTTGGHVSPGQMGH